MGVGQDGGVKLHELLEATTHPETSLSVPNADLSTKRSSSGSERGRRECSIKLKRPRCLAEGNDPQT